MTVRRVTRAVWERRDGDGILSPALRFTIEANAFLFRMVRRVVITLAQVGCGRLGVKDVREILASRDSRRVKGIAPACGLCLVEVTY